MNYFQYKIEIFYLNNFLTSFLITYLNCMKKNLNILLIKLNKQILQSIQTQKLQALK